MYSYVLIIRHIRVLHPIDDARVAFRSLQLFLTFFDGFGLGIAKAFFQPLEITHNMLAFLTAGHFPHRVEVQGWLEPVFAAGHPVFKKLIQDGTILAYSFSVATKLYVEKKLWTLHRSAK